MITNNNQILREMSKLTLEFFANTEDSIPKAVKLDIHNVERIKKPKQSEIN
jgi:hypothetical protein